MEEVVGGAIHPGLAGIPLAEEAFALMKSRLTALHWDTPVLTHDDYWPGNSVWQRGRLSGIVDWSTAEFGDPRTDVAQCRVDLTMMYGPGWADEFARCYVEAGGASMRDLWFWDLARGLSSRRQVHHFVEGYRDYGLREITMDTAGTRLEEFLRRAMDAAES
jgi:aminoglycoside phosphotransferase (APT) family kinase protein